MYRYFNNNPLGRNTVGDCSVRAVSKALGISWDEAHDLLADMSKDDEETCIRLIMTLKQRYDIKNDNIVRKMDITGEMNPMKWHDNEKWNKDIKGRLIDIKKTEPK